MRTKLYIIDDEDAILQDLVVLFTANSSKNGHPDYDIHTAKDGLEPLLNIMKHRKRYDVMITNIKMPKLDGTELLQRLHLYQPNLPIIIYSAILDENNKIDLIGKGAFAAISKSAERELLLEAVKKAVQHAFACMN